MKSSWDRDTLFPTGLPERTWAEFAAAGFSNPVSGMVFRGAHPPCCGVALGGLGTGCLDVEASGVLGFSSIFPAPWRRPSTKLLQVYRNPQLLLPFLGLALEGKTWVLATRKFVEGGAIEGCTEVGMREALRDDADWIAAWSAHVPKIEGVEPVQDIHYWGHYPVADLEYELDAPVKVGLRAWAPFIPGDLGASSIPAAVFEVHVRNGGPASQRVTLAFSFPGPVATDPAYGEFVHAEVSETFQGLTVSSPDGKMGYALGVIGDGAAGSDAEEVRVGSGLAGHPGAWSEIASELPSSPGRTGDGGTLCADPSASVAVDFHLEAGEAKVVRFVLAWYAPQWTGGGYKDILGFEQWDIGPWEMPGRQSEEGERYVAMYAARYDSALDVARRVAQDHVSLLRRVLAWQQEIYASEELPVWLRDSLVNNLNLIPEDSYWAQPREPLDDWSFPEGAFGLVESPRGCSIMGCIVSNWYGDLPILYFFPELEKMVLRDYREYIRPDGAVPFLWPNGDWTKPTYEWLLPLNGPCFVDLVGRLWLRTGDDAVLREFYPAVKRSTRFTMGLKPGPEGVISVHREGAGQEWWEFTPVYGMVTHVAGMRLSNLSIAQRMAEAMGDEEFAAQCQEWYAQGSKLLEEKLWAGDSYLFYSDPATGNESDDILSSQLDGEWANRFHGLEGVFQQDRVQRVLETIERTCLVDCGVVGFATRAGEPQLTAYGTFTAEIMLVGMAYMYGGWQDLGMEILRRNMDNLVRRQGHGWDLPNMVRCDTGARHFGTDYFQNMMLWAVPAAIAGQDLTGPCQPGGLVDRVIRAGADW